MSETKRPGRTVKACTNCRQQKLRCDASDNPSKQCSRCGRLHLECVVLRSFKRVKKKTKTELQQEVEFLREQMSMGAPTRPPVDDLLMQPDVADQDGVSPSLLSNPSQGDRTVEYSPLAQNQDVGNALLEPSLLSEMLRSRHNADASSTSPRSLDGFEVEAHKIDDCFSLFFSNYAHILPILDAQVSPDDYYLRCPQLFWTIVGVGCRQYVRDPTLLTRLAPSIQNMALSSLAKRMGVIEMIQSLLILSTWPFPFNSASKAMVHIFSSAAVNLAQQIGLHVVGVGQDFARVKLNPDETVKAYRAQLWNYCIIINQSNSYADGLLPSVLTAMDKNDITRALALLSPDLQYRYKIHQVALDATQAMQQAGLAQSDGYNTALLHSLIGTFDRQVSSMPPLTGTSGMNRIYYILARLHVRTFNLFSTHSPETFAPLLSVYETAVEAIETVTAMCTPAAVCTFYIHRMLVLAALAVLKILRSDMHKSAVDARTGECAYFSAIMFLRRLSMAHDDISARGADILAQMWASDSVFKSTDGARDSLTLRIRSRLTISVIYDVFWWWREEIAGLASPYKEKREKNITASERPDIRANGNQDQEMHSRAPAEFDSIPYFGSEFDDLAEFSWTGALKDAALDEPVDETIFGMTPGSN